MKWLVALVGALLGGATFLAVRRSAPREVDEQPVPFVPAMGHGSGSAGRRVDLIVLHTTEPPTGDPLAPGVARATANYFAAGADGHHTSSHYIVGPEEAIQAVRDDDIAYHALGVNPRSIGVELTGRKMSAADWEDPRAQRMLARAATIVARVARERDVPISFVTAEQMLAGERGVTTHAEVTAAYHESTHTDPGPAFPMGRFLELVRASSGEGQA